MSSYDAIKYIQDWNMRLQSINVRLKEWESNSLLFIPCLLLECYLEIGIMRVKHKETIN
jgi:hypothetical protein